MQRVTLKTAPELKALVLTAFPSYKKHDVFLSVFGEHGKSINSYWDGGSRSVFCLVDIASRRTKSLPTQSHPYFDVARQGLANADSPDVSVDQRGNVTLKHLPEGFALIEGGTFCGKTATAHVFLPAANMAKLVAA